MIVKFFRHGSAKYGKSGSTGGGNAVKDYLLKDPKDKTKDRTGATLIRGNADQTTEIINNIDRKLRYKSGVLSFAKGETVTDEQKQAIIDSFENTLFVGLDKDSYSGYWVEHQDKDRLELHFVFAETELKTNKSLAIYYHKVDKSLIDTWKDLTNDKYNLLDPNDPSTKKAITPNTLKTRNEKDNALKDEISNKILACIEFMPNINNRDDVLNTIDFLGYKVNRSNQPDSISIKHPQGGRPLKLKGDIFSKKFDRTMLPSQRKKQKIKYDKEHDSRIAQKQADYQKYLALREKRTIRRIGTIDRTPYSKQLSDEIEQIRLENEPKFLGKVEQEKIQEQINRLKLITGYYTQQIYDDHKDIDPSKLTDIRALYDRITSGLDDMASRQIVPNFDKKVIEYADSKNHIATFDVISNERKQAEQQDIFAEQIKRLSTMTAQIVSPEYYQEWQQAEQKVIDKIYIDYQTIAQDIYEKAHHEILSDSDFDEYNQLLDAIATMNDINAKREHDRLINEEISHIETITSEILPNVYKKQTANEYLVNIKQQLRQPPTTTTTAEPTVTPVNNENVVLRSVNDLPQQAPVIEPPSPPKITLNLYQQTAYNLVVKYGLDDTEENKATFINDTKDDLLKFENPYQSEHQEYLALVHSHAQTLKNKDLAKIVKAIKTLQESEPNPPKKGMFESEGSHTKRHNDYVNNELKKYNKDLADKCNERDNLYNFGRLDNYLNQSHFDHVAKQNPDLAYSESEYNQYEKMRTEIAIAFAQIDRQTAQANDQQQVKQIKSDKDR